jgi:hypothetical protein
MVAVRDSTAVTGAALGLGQIAKQDVLHTDGLVDRWGRNRGPLGINENQRHGGDQDEKNESSVHAIPSLAGNATIHRSFKPERL